MINSQNKIEHSSYHKTTIVLPYIDHNMPYTLGSFNSQDISKHMDYISHSIYSCNNVPNQTLHSSWIIDIRAIDHMVHSMRIFHTCYLYSSHFNKTSQWHNYFYYIGIKISNSLILTDELCVPSFFFTICHLSANTPKIINAHLSFYLICVFYRTLGMEDNWDG